MLKVLFIGHYNEQTGWGVAARDYIEALSTVKEIDLVCRPIVLSGGFKDKSDNIRTAEGKSHSNPDVCIQHVLPHFFNSSAKINRNIGLFVTETDTIAYNPWQFYLEQMDSIIVPNFEMKENITPFFDKTIDVIPHACDISKFTKKYPELKINELGGTFKFYFIGEFNRRKNLAALLEAFHTEFDYSEAVSLIIKTSIPKANPAQSKQIVEEFCNKVKQSLRLYSKHQYYHKEAIITDRLTDEQIYGLHLYGDCHVAPSFGEAWNIPAFDAMGFGKTPICINHGGPKDYIIPDKLNTGTIIESYPEIVCGMEDTLQDMFTGRETWFNADRDELQYAMRHYYENKDCRGGLQPYIDGLEQAKKFSYEAVGKKIAEILL